MIYLDHLLVFAMLDWKKDSTANVCAIASLHNILAWFITVTTFASGIVSAIIKFITWMVTMNAVNENHKSCIIGIHLWLYGLEL